MKKCKERIKEIIDSKGISTFIIQQILCLSGMILFLLQQ
jgi:hypothetical protein